MFALFSLSSPLISERLVLNGFGLGAFGIKVGAAGPFSNVLLIELSESFFFLDFIISFGFFHCLPELLAVYMLQQSVITLFLSSVYVSKLSGLPA